MVFFSFKFFQGHNWLTVINCHLYANSGVSQAWSLHACWARMLYTDRLETIDNCQSTNSAKTLKIFNVNGKEYFTSSENITIFFICMSIIRLCAIEEFIRTFESQESIHSFAVLFLTGTEKFAESYPCILMFINVTFYLMW